jgi:hypothetical protein
LAQDALIIKIIQSSCLRSLKIDTRLAPECRVDNDPLQIIVRLKKRCSMFRQILCGYLVAGAFKTGVQFGTAFVQR